MKRPLLLALMLLCCIFVTPVLYTNAQINKSFGKTIYKDGDIIFQKSHSRQAEAVKLATHSDISHCGILFNEDGEWKVLEAVEPVQIVPLSSWISREEGHYTIKRLKKEHNTLNDARISSMLSTGKKWTGKHYDIYFNWNDDQLYCSELVWKLYHMATGIEICSPRKLKEFDLSNPFVKMMMNERYGKNIPYNENMVAPSDLFDSKKLELVVSE